MNDLAPIAALNAKGLIAVRVSRRDTIDGPGSAPIAPNNGSMASEAEVPSSSN
ncbi:hypothetical protein [Bradyrhizobium sp. USDA 4451]